MSKPDKYARMSQELHKAKLQRIKDVQNEWKSKFVDPKSEQQPQPLPVRTTTISSVVTHEREEEQ